MTLAITASIALLVTAVGLAVTLGWRRYGAQPVRNDAEIGGTTCYPSVPRDGRAR